MIPTIAFGVPGSTVTALVLVVFWAVGINPGPKLLTDHLDLVYLIVWSDCPGEYYRCGRMLSIDQQIGPDHQSSGPYFSPLGDDRDCCRHLVCYGFCWRYRFTHLRFGILGWFMKSLGWPRPAFLLAFILGPLIEKFYFHSVMMYDYAWLLRPAVIVILLCCCRHYLPGIENTR